MKRIVSLEGLLGLVILLAAALYAYNSSPGITVRNRFYTPPTALQKLLKRFQRLQLQSEEIPPALPFVYRDENPRDFSIALANQPLGLRKSQVLLGNPFAAAPFPLSYSMIYRGNLVVLFEPGYFACYQLPALTRNRKLEQQLNTRKFAYHWVLSQELVALADGRPVAFTEKNGWQPYTQPLPLSQQPKLFEDARYVVCMRCNGEFGGEVYFYDKQQHCYYIARATCPVAVTKRGGKYFVLSALAHMMGSAELQQIDNPAELTRWVGENRPQDRDFARSYDAKLSQGKKLFDYSGLLLLSGFTLNGQTLYLVSWRNTTFLATWQAGTFRAVDPLFYNDIYANDPVTVDYGPAGVLMNIDSSEGVETSCLLFAGNQAIKINWSKSSVIEEYATDPMAPIDSAYQWQITDSVDVQLVR
ncbi:hypothetical protein J7E24_16630 [Hymenobacter sp. ISL-91]|uniref:hypothetical protein n=1 Tax=Hymenobacter sp. ISL-91 TaxID=2819151 RepID=UPI001BEA1375|nr:hypothetical protein [Hymenobacter sp. ISL-91]MBT2559417.1 hypothetical protein [Hymenobacter sp. ISL-91]